MQVYAAGFENGPRTGVSAGQYRCCGLCVVCGVTFSLARIARGIRGGSQGGYRGESDPWVSGGPGGHSDEPPF